MVEVSDLTCALGFTRNRRGSFSSHCLPRAVLLFSLNPLSLILPTLSSNAFIARQCKEKGLCFHV